MGGLSCLPPPFPLFDSEIFRGRRWCFGWLCAQGAGPANFLNFSGAAQGSEPPGSAVCRGEEEGSALRGPGAGVMGGGSDGPGEGGPPLSCR